MKKTKKGCKGNTPENQAEARFFCFAMFDYMYGNFLAVQH